LARKRWEVVNYPGRRFAVQFNGTALDFKDVRQDPDGAAGAIVDNSGSRRVGADQGAAGRLPERGGSAGMLRGSGHRQPQGAGLPSKGRAPRHGAAAAPA